MVYPALRITEYRVFIELLYPRLGEVICHWAQRGETTTGELPH
jgi:hypothetical protein